MSTFVGTAAFSCFTADPSLLYTRIQTNHHHNLCEDQCTIFCYLFVYICKGSLTQHKKAMLYKKHADLWHSYSWTFFYGKPDHHIFPHISRKIVGSFFILKVGVDLYMGLKKLLPYWYIGIHQLMIKSMQHI